MQTSPKLQGRANILTLTGINISLKTGYRGKIALYSPQNFTDGILLGGFCKHISSLRTAAAPEQTGLCKISDNLFQIFYRDRLSSCNILNETQSLMPCSAISIIILKAYLPLDEIS